jgi:hypothetical protein
LIFLSVVCGPVLEFGSLARRAVTPAILTLAQLSAVERQAVLRKAGMRVVKRGRDCLNSWLIFYLRKAAKICGRGGPQRGRILTPATALSDVLAERLRKAGMKVEVGL